MFKSILCLFALLISFSAEAVNVVESFEQGGSDRGGGDGIYLNGKLYLLDLVEAGAEEVVTGRSLSHPIINEAMIPLVFSLQLRDETAQTLGHKLVELGEQSKYGTYLISTLLAIKNLSWALVNVDLKNVDDEDTQILCNSQCVQLAVRQNDTVYINRKLFEALNPTHQAALILHEALYYTLDNGKLASSAEIRKMVGFFFHSPAAYRTYMNNGRIEKLFASIFGENFQIVLNALAGTETEDFFEFRSPYIEIFWESESGHSFSRVLRNDIQSGADYLSAKKLLCDDQAVPGIRRAKRLIVKLRGSLMLFWNGIRGQTYYSSIDGQTDYIFENFGPGGESKCLETIFKPLQTLSSKLFSHFKPF